MTESIILKIIDKISPNWIITFILLYCFYYVSKNLLKHISRCLLRINSHNTRKYKKLLLLYEENRKEIKDDLNCIIDIINKIK